MNGNVPYNTQKKRLIIPEYGRLVNDMALHILDLEEHEKQKLAAETLVDLMLQLNADDKGKEENLQKCWDHLHIMTEFKLSFEGPFSKPDPEELSKKPDLVPYSTSKKYKYRFYGKIIPKFVQLAAEEIKEGDKKEVTEVIANLMKKAYLNWNRDSVEDELIFTQLEELSNGKLKKQDEIQLEKASDLIIDAQSSNSISKRKPKRRKKYKKKTQN